MDSINGIPIIWDSEGDKNLFGKLFNQDPFAPVRTNKSFEEISNEYALRSPFGEKSLFSSEPIRQSTNFIKEYSIRWLYTTKQSQSGTTLIKEYRKHDSVVTESVGNTDEINDFIALTKNDPLHVRFIEFMPFDGNKWSSNKVLSLDEILNTAAHKYNYTKLPDEKNATAKKFSIAGHKGTFAIISTMTSPFCSTCNRLRLTADGKLKNCLFSTSETDLLTPFRNGENILPLITGNIQDKAAATGGQLSTDLAVLSAESLTNRSMINIGG